MASCLVPEHPHDMNTHAAADPSLANVSYSNCIGFIPADPAAADPAAAAAAAAAAAEERHIENVAHYSVVVSAAANDPGLGGDGLRVLSWLAQQQPEAVAAGVTVPKVLREQAPGYGGCALIGNSGLKG
jgi:hypothetical protein